MYLCVCVCVCAVWSFVLHQPLLHARVEHSLVRVPPDVFDAGNSAEDQIPASRQRLQTEDVSQVQLEREEKGARVSA